MIIAQPRDFRWNDAALLAWNETVAQPRNPKTPKPAPPGESDDERAERVRPATPPVPRDLAARGADLLRRMIEFGEIERRRRDKKPS